MCWFAASTTSFFSRLHRCTTACLSSSHSSSRFWNCTSQLSMTEHGTASSVPSCATTLGAWRETAWKRARTVLISRPTA
eukprot:scaffold98632_cov54-Phaeocystis_antarctica.AAC.2